MRDNDLRKRIGICGKSRVSGSWRGLEEKIGGINDLIMEEVECETKDNELRSKRLSKGS